ncbi:MAG: hypothetical protein CL940_13335, partial [Deltaproteobacteria bacterium]|nr:hypothetical protein [Deltaproteobacteria bacterium]
MNGLSRSLLSLSLVAALAAALSACAEEEKPRPNGELCGAPSQCVSNLCHSSTCLDPAADDDGDGLINEVEFALGTNATIPDSDGDGIPDYTEVVDPSAAADQDGDGTIDALESAHIDTDCNGLPDQYDPGGIEPDPLKPPETLCSDDIVAKFPDLAGLCCPDADEDGVEDLMDCDPNDEFVKVDTDCLTGTYLQDKCNNYACQKGFKCVPTSKCPAGDEPCSTNTCDEDTGECTFVPADQNCDDGNECTVDTCVNDQECLHLEVICTDGEPCTEDYCNPKEGCLYDPIEDGTLDCIDQTKQDQDGDGVLDAEDNCPLKPNTDQLNTDSDSQGDVCDDDDDNDSSPDADDCEPLNAEVYPGANEDCDGIDNNCNDQIDEGLCDDKPCHTGQCQPGPDQECTYEPVADGVECEDGSLCTSGDSCQGGQCTGVELSCAAEPCQQAACNPDTGVCEPLEPLADGSECNDGEGCTVEDVCKDGFCVGEAKVCDDGNECTEDWCDSATGSCQTLDSDDGVMCDLENPCSYESVCMGGSCEEWLPTSCDDGNPCTTEGECDPEAGGCVYAVSEDLCGFDEVCGELESCIADCAAVNTIGLTSDAYLNKGFVEQDGGTWFCDKNQGNDCVVNESAMPTSNGAFVFNISAKFPQDGTLRLKILNEIECALPDGTDATALFPVYQVLLTMDEGVADARIVRLLELSEFCGMQTQTTVIGEPGVPELPGPGAWFSYSVGVDADGSLDIALPDGGTWFHTKMDTPLSIQGPYSFQPKISGGTEISPLLLVPNVDSCCATDADCEGGDPCTEHSCIEGACVVQSEGCDDGDPCTKDICQAQGCSFVVINDESSVSDQKQGIDDGCQSLGCTPVVTSTSEEVTTYCTAICDTIDKCEEENLVIIGGGLDVPGGDVSCLDNCRDDLSENLLSASFWSCRSGLAEEEGLCGPPEEGEIAELCGTAECPPEVAPTCEGLCEELEGCGFSGLDEAPDEFAAIWGPGPLCAHSCTGFGLAGLATAVVKNCVTKVFEQEACDYETAGLCGSMGTCASICEEAFGDSAESPGCHVGTPLHAQLASFDECRGTCMDLPVNKRSRFMGCFQVSGCGPMASECTDPEADFGDVSVVCEQECTAAIEACGPLPYLPTVQSCKSWCEGAAVSSQGLDQSIDLAGALLAADCPTGVERLRVFFSELLEMVPACEEACATSAAVACYGPQGENGTYDESGCQQSCSNDYFTQSTGFIEDGSCG